MTYSVENWRKAMLSVMMVNPDKKWRKEELFNEAYEWLVENNIPEIES